MSILELKCSILLVSCGHMHLVLMLMQNISWQAKILIVWYQPLRSTILRSSNYQSTRNDLSSNCWSICLGIPENHDPNQQQQQQQQQQQNLHWKFSKTERENSSTLKSNNLYIIVITHYYLAKTIDLDTIVAIIDALKSPLLSSHCLTVNQDPSKTHLTLAIKSSQIADGRWRSAGVELTDRAGQKRRNDQIG